MITVADLIPIKGICNSTCRRITVIMFVLILLVACHRLNNNNK